VHKLYADYNSTAPLLPSVKNVVLETLEIYGNPSAVHSIGREAKRIIEKARKSIAEAFQAKEICFTASGTESNHIAISGLGIDPQYICSLSTDHSSVVQNIFPENRIPVDANGQLLISDLHNRFNSSTPPKLISIGLANAETGIVQNLSELVELCHKNDCLVHADAVQAVGKIACSFEDSKVDLMSISAHKIGGARGAAALLYKPYIQFKNMLLGGGQEKGIRSGTENVPAIAGFSEAVNHINYEKWSEIKDLLTILKNRMLSSSVDVSINSKADGLPNTLNLSTLGIQKDVQIVCFDIQGIAISAGSACSSGKVKRSHVLEAMGIDAPYVDSAIRISLGPNSSPLDIELIFNAWASMDANNLEQNTKVL
jgi:cysteine desulfurase